MVIVMAVLSVCSARSQKSHPPMAHLADSIISMAYITHLGPEFMIRPGDSRIKRLFRKVDDLFDFHEHNLGNFWAWLQWTSHYCHMEPQAGYFCGSRTFDPNAPEGYLFVSSWIGRSKRKFMVMILSTGGPEHTFIARIAHDRAQLIYNSFAAKNMCSVGPGSAWVRLHIVHFVKVLSPRTYILKVGSSEPYQRSERMRLRIGLSSCSITRLTRRSGKPVCTAEKVCYGHPYLMMAHLADGLVSMAYVAGHDRDFLRRPGDPQIKEWFRKIDALFDFHEQHFGDFWARLQETAHYCHLELQAGYFCGSRTFDPDSKGYLFASSWIGQDKRKFMVMILSTGNPEQTIIARVVHDGAQLIYNSFAAKNRCSVGPRSASVKLNIVHFVKVLSPRTYILKVGGDRSNQRSERIRLHVSLSSCSITWLKGSRFRG